MSGKNRVRFAAALSDDEASMCLASSFRTRNIANSLIRAARGNDHATQWRFDFEFAWWPMRVLAQGGSQRWYWLRPYWAVYTYEHDAHWIKYNSLGAQARLPGPVARTMGF